MPIFLLIFGILFLVATIRGKEQQDKLIALLKSDFTGAQSFGVWMLFIGALVSLGYVKVLRPFSNGFLGLAFLAIVLRKKGPDGRDIITSFFNQVEGK